MVELLGDRDLLLGQGAVSLRLIGARITGSLDMSHARLDRPLIVECCYFDEPIDLVGARLA